MASAVAEADRVCCEDARRRASTSCAKKVWPCPLGWRQSIIKLRSGIAPERTESSNAPRIETSGTP